MADRCPWCMENGIKPGASVCSFCGRAFQNELSKEMNEAGGCQKFLGHLCLFWLILGGLFWIFGDDGFLDSFQAAAGLVRQDFLLVVHAGPGCPVHFHNPCDQHLHRRSELLALEIHAMQAAIHHYEQRSVGVGYDICVRWHTRHGWECELRDTTEV